MERKRLFLVLSAIPVIIVVLILVLAKTNVIGKNGDLEFVYPFNETLFPPEFPSPTFTWTDKNKTLSEWKVTLFTANKNYEIDTIVHEPHWQPDSVHWEKMKASSHQGKIYAVVSRVTNNSPKVEDATSGIYFKISTDEVGAPILYREVPLPFAYAEKHPDLLSYKLVNVGSYEPPYYSMQKFMVCGNCHSFSEDGGTIGLDFDAALRDKGGYFVARVKDTIVFDTSNYLSWNKLQKSKTFGMFSRVSPDGRYIITTIKDRVLSWNTGTAPDKIAFSQIFFPVNGVLAVYDRKTKKIWELPGANLPEYVQSNAAWTPDQKNIVFVRTKAFPSDSGGYDMKINDTKIVNEFGDRKRDFKFDVYIVPFNNGKGGTARPIKGASDNGMSNYFPTVSPDGKWVVFCEAENYMLLNPDSKLYIVPLEGGRARKLRCNLYRMNSWHAFSPNGKWMVFSSKGFSIFTDLLLTHIDEDGNASPPVLLERARKEQRAANYPEFVNRDPNKRFTMVYKYVNLDHITRAMVNGDTASAKILYKEFLAQGQYSLPGEYVYLAQFNMDVKDYDQAVIFLNKALEKDPKNSAALALMGKAKRYLAKHH